MFRNPFRRSFRIPPPSFFEEADMNTEYTPDMWKLRQYQSQYLFVYGEMMHGHWRHSLLAGAKRHCAAFTEDKYSLFRKNLGKVSEPFALDEKFYTTPYARIKGELYEIKPNPAVVIKELDKCKLNGLHFLRDRRKIRIPYTIAHGWQKERDFAQGLFETVDAWIYLGVPEYWNPQLDAGLFCSAVNTFKPKDFWDSPYYCFTPMEYKNTPTTHALDHDKEIKRIVDLQNERKTRLEQATVPKVSFFRRISRMG